MEDGADFAEGGEALFVEDAGAEVVVEIVAEGFEIGAVSMRVARREGFGSGWSVPTKGDGRI